jgi:hypothetical protein
VESKKAASDKVRALEAAAEKARNGSETGAGPTARGVTSSLLGADAPRGDDDAGRQQSDWPSDAMFVEMLQTKSCTAESLNGVKVGEWANCELLQPLLSALSPEEELESAGILVLDIATAQLLKLADADQQCEAIIDGPQCEAMRRQMVSASLILAVINDNEDAEAADGGRHWSVVVARRAGWRHGTFVVEHYDPSGDAELNCEAAKQFASALAERLSELRDEAADRIEVVRVPAPVQHDGAVCGLTSICYAKRLIDSERGSRGSDGADAVSRVAWREVEALRLTTARAWQHELIDEAEVYARELRAVGLRTRVCTSQRHVVFDLYDEEGDSEGFDELLMDRAAETKAAPQFVSGSTIATTGETIDGSLYDFLQAVGLTSLSKPLGDARFSLSSCASQVNERPALLQRLKDAGVDKLHERQAFVNAVSKALRDGWLRPPYKGPFTSAGREMRLAREMQPKTVAPSLAQAGPYRAGHFIPAVGGGRGIF